jgi:hypothetical protein
MINWVVLSRKKIPEKFLEKIKIIRENSYGLLGNK